ncbi:MAG TPA: hypothetical protein VFX98_03485 [Longimicrobiaceae bacterium]|nr:hypothetical protein [Longimicrobiaceae bacterium]
MAIPPRGKKQQRGPDDFRKYLKKAFLFRWNLLAFLGAVGAAVLSGQPDAILPLVVAGELTYLGSMVSFPRFRKAVDREGYRSPHFQPEGAKDTAQKLPAMVASLPKEAQARFNQLRMRALRMRELAHGVRGATGDPDAPGTEIHTSALDRLLWVFLRLLLSQSALQQFLKSTSEAELQSRTADLKRRLETATTSGDERVLRSLTDSVAVAELRLDNYRKARSNAEFVQIELDRIEAKVQALTEMAINRQDPDFLSSQVDAAAESMTHTESAMAELQSITGLVDDLEEPPPILEAGSYDVA